MAEIISSGSGPISPSTTTESAPTEAPSSTEFGGGNGSSSQGKSAAQLRPRPGESSTPKAEGQTGRPDETNGQANGTEKRESRYERTKRQRAALQQREAALAQREQQLAEAERAKNAPKKPDYTVAELKQYREEWAKEADYDPEKKSLVEAADKEIKRLEALEQQETKSADFTKEWQSAEKELYEADPEFMRPGTRLDKQLRELMAGPDGNAYRGHPRGIVAAYHRAKMILLEGDFNASREENQKLQTEIKRLNGLLGIGGGSPGRVGNGNRVESVNDFARLSTKDMRKHLRSHADKSGDMPWL